MHAQLKKDAIKTQKLSGERHQKYKAHTDNTSAFLCGETTEGFIGSANHFQTSDSQSQLPMQFKGSLEKPEPVNRNAQPIQRRFSNTGLPDNLKNGIENLSGISMNDVSVHYNSSKPAQLQAYAFAQGSVIHVAPGQEQHLPHEAWHVVQQKQGRVKPNLQMNGTKNINDDDGLEHEADVMGVKALQTHSSPSHCLTGVGSERQMARSDVSGEGVIQRDGWPWWLSWLPGIPGQRRQRRLTTDLGNDRLAPTNSRQNKITARNPRFTGRSRVRFDGKQAPSPRMNTLPDINIPLTVRRPDRDLVGKKDVMGGRVNVVEHPDRYRYVINNGRLVHNATNTVLDTNAQYREDEEYMNFIMDGHLELLVDKGFIDREDIKEMHADQSSDNASEESGADAEFGEESKEKLLELGGVYIWVMSTDGDIYATSLAKEQVSGKHHFHHTSFLNRASVACGGEMGVIDGKIKWIDNGSGHYKPGIAYLWQALNVLKRQGVDLSEVKIALEKFDKQIRFENAQQFVDAMSVVMRNINYDFTENVAENKLRELEGSKWDWEALGIGYRNSLDVTRHFI